jgi:hypothetical protein
MQKVKILKNDNKPDPNRKPIFDDIKLSYDKTKDCDIILSLKETKDYGRTR